MSVTGESRLLIDGKLVTATGGRTYPNVNPATEEVIGQVADATPQDMDRAIAAARRAFDTTDWSVNLAKRATCLRQLHAALVKHKEDLRPQIVAEVGASSAADMGKVMGAAKTRLAGKADMGAVSAAVKQALAK